ncbi:uncharacterized protein LOC119662742 [Teleopsis dalmanni]|uniref:uncharacterized protein LOC119662742 n=1 Tax=Teleopsis dalmanni TaxID=139649 RepID=UPI0018CDDF1F|nr:uncharacterized protein LOC119662742 [Teleopsis dalmanni]
MDCRRFNYGGGDVDYEALPLHHIIDYYNLPLVGGIHASFVFPELQHQAQLLFQGDVEILHNRLRRQFEIPDSAFDISFQHLWIGSTIITFETFKFKMDYSRDNRQKQLLFQQRLDLLIKEYYVRRLVELAELGWQQWTQNHANRNS